MDVVTQQFKLKSDGKLIKTTLSVFKPKGSKLMYRLHFDIGEQGQVVVIYPNKTGNEFTYYKLNNKAIDQLTEKAIKKVKTLNV